MQTTRNHTVQGMTCSHGVLSVQAEVGAVTGITSVDVDHESGAMTVTGTDLDDDEITATVADAGYEVAP